MPTIKQASTKLIIIRLIKIVILLLVIASLLSGGFLLWQHYYPVTTHQTWGYQVLHQNIAKPSALIVDKQGHLIVANELNNQKGSIISIDSSGQITTLFSQLDKPDGIVKLGDGYVYSQEENEHPVVWVVNGKTYNLFTGINVQGLTVEGEYLYAVEDRKGNGRLFKYNTQTKQLIVLRDNLYESEILAICPDGRKFYNEKTKGRIRQYTEDGKDPIYLEGLKQPSFLRCDNDGLWISEDATHRARLLLYTPNQQLITIASFLRSPQHLYKIDEQNYLLAEQGRNRILKITRKHLVSLEK